MLLLLLALGAADVAFTDINDLGVEGRAWDDRAAPFDRLPAKAAKFVRPAVWSLSRHSAGMAVRFRTDATAIHARWTLTSEALALPHMPATGVSGLDLYVKVGQAYPVITYDKKSDATKAPGWAEAVAFEAKAAAADAACRADAVPVALVAADPALRKFATDHAAALDAVAADWARMTTEVASLRTQIK